MAISAFGAVLLFSLVASLSARPDLPPLRGFPPANRGVYERTVREAHTLSTELQPPPLNENEQHETIYLVNLYAVKNATGNTTTEMLEDEVINAVPDILEPLANILLVVEDDEEVEGRHSPVDLAEFGKLLERQGFKIDKIGRDGETKVLRIKVEKAKAKSLIESSLKPDDEKKARGKRSICLKCGGRGGGGGWGGYSGGGYYPPSGGGGGGYYPPSGGGGGGYYPPSGGGGGGYCPNCGGQGGGGGHHRGGYPRGGGCGYRCGGGGGGGGGSYSQSSASAQSSSGSWGRK